MTPRRRISILRLLLSAQPGSAPYHQVSLPVTDRQEIALCSYFPPASPPPEGIDVFAGDGTLRGYFRALRTTVTRKRYDVVHAHSPHVAVFYLLNGLFCPRRSRPPLIYTVHSSWPNYRWKHRVMLLGVLLASKRIACCSRSGYDSLPGLLRRLAGQRIAVIHNGVNLRRIDGVLGRLSDGPPDKPFTVAWVGRLTAVKRPLSILEAFRRLAGGPARLVMVGDGPMRPAVEKEIEKRRLGEGVRLTGLIERERVYEALAGADLFVSTSSVEGLPVALLEAMACRTPVVVSDIPPHREIAGQAEAVPLVPVDDPAVLAAQIERFRVMPAAQRRRAGEDCRRLVERRFALDRMHHLYEGMYQDAIDASQ